MHGSADEPRRWTCAVCERRVFRVEVTAVALALGSGWQVRFHTLGACREHQPQIRQQLTLMWPTSVARVSAHVRPKALATWAATARKELVAITVDRHGTANAFGSLVGEGAHEVSA